MAGITDKEVRALSRPGGGKFMANIDAGAKPVKVSGNQIMDEMFKRYGLLVDGEAQAFFQFLLHNQAQPGSYVIAAQGWETGLVRGC